MKYYRIAERYAGGLSAAIPETERLEEAVAALDAIAALYRDNHDFSRVLSNPALNAGDRARVLHKILALGEFPPMVCNLAELMVRRGRVALLGDVAELFSAIADERLNRVEARVQTASALADTQVERLQRALEKHFEKSIRMDCRVEPRLLGGVVARVGGVVIDGSVRTRLENLRTTLLAEEQ